MRHACRTSGLATLALVLLLPASAHGDATVDFEALPPGTAITNQYKDQGGTNRGPLFASQPGGTTHTPPEIEQVAPGEAQSGVRVADICTCHGEFSNSYTWVKFPITKQFVRIFAGIGFGNTTVTLSAYNAAGNPIPGASQTKTVSAGTGYKTMLEVTSATPNIAFVFIHPPDPIGTNFSTIRFDDLTYDTPVVPPPPDFALNYDPNQIFGSIGLNPGKSAGLGLDINRVNGSSGPLSFTAAGLPSGVSASFTPNDASNPTSVSMNLTASGAPGSFDGNFTVTATPTGGSSSPGNAARTIQVPLTVLQNFDIRINGIEVSQGAQSSTLPARDPASPNSPVTYTGALLAKGGKTVVRVYANVKNPSGGSVQDVEALLYGAKTSGGSLPGSPIGPNRHPLDLSFGDATVDLADRAGRDSFEFVLPSTWTTGSIKLEAKLLPTELLFGPSAAECESAACAANNSFALNGIVFLSTPDIEIAPVELTVDGWNPPPAASTAFAKGRNLTPLGDGQLKIPPYLTTIDVSDIALGTYKSYFGPLLFGTTDNPLPDIPLPGSTVTALTHERLRGMGQFFPGDLLVGVNPGGIRGQSNGAIFPLGSRRSAIVRFWDGINSDGTRPLTSVAHELLHAWGQPHAGTDPNCYSDPGDLGVDWPPDQRGFLQSVGVDRTPGSGGSLSSFRPIVSRNLSGVGSADPNAADFQPPDWYDLMSYCASVGGGDVDAWISQRHWNGALAWLVTYAALGGRRKIAAAQTTDVLTVRALETPDAGVQLMKVGPAEGPTQMADSSPYHMVLKDTAGQVLSDTPMMVSKDHIEDGGGPTVLEAAVPAGGGGGALRSAQVGGAKRLELTSGGTVVASRERTANTPRVTVRSPRAGARVGRNRTTRVSWTTTDADGTVGFTASIDYSTNGGSSWRTVWTGPDEGRADIASTALPASRNARVRVRVNDGFNEGSGRSGVFTSVGRPPSVLITSPPRGSSIPADATLYLAGQAYDDTGRALTGRRLTWFDGRRRLGTGPIRSVRGLTPGSHRLRLVATDRLRRRSAAAVSVRVTAVPPQFLVLTAPPSLAQTATKLSLRVASTLPANLSVAGPGVRTTRARVNRKSRNVSVRVTPGATALNLALRLSVGRQVTRLTVLVPRS